MKIDRWGGVVLGLLLLMVGIGILLSDLDPQALCNKRCDLPRLFAAIFGAASLRIVVGALFTLIGLLFLFPRRRG